MQTHPSPQHSPHTDTDLVHPLMALGSSALTWKQAARLCSNPFLEYLGNKVGQ